LRDIDPGLQMADKTKTLELHYDQRLILPKLPYPNRFYGFTRHRPLVRSVESAFWERALPKINEKIQKEKEIAAQYEKISN
jgi:hypothetical protein